jgi:hypothetical protein
MAAELTTVAGVKTYLGISSSTYDTLLGTLLTGAEKGMRGRYCRPDGWTQAVFTEYFDGENSERLVLTNTPIDTTYTSMAVTVDGLTLDADTYTFDPASGVLAFKYASNTLSANFFAAGRTTIPALGVGKVPGFTNGFRNVAVTYRGGYSSIPEDLALAAQMYVGYLFSRRGADVALASHTLGSHSYTFATLDDFWRQIDDLIQDYDRCIGA